MYPSQHTPNCCIHGSGTKPRTAQSFASVGSAVPSLPVHDLTIIMPKPVAPVAGKGRCRKPSGGSVVIWHVDLFVYTYIYVCTCCQRDCIRCMCTDRCLSADSSAIPGSSACRLYVCAGRHRLHYSQAKGQGVYGPVSSRAAHSLVGLCQRQCPWLKCQGQSSNLMDRSEASTLKTFPVVLGGQLRRICKQFHKATQRCWLRRRSHLPSLSCTSYR